MLFSVLIPLEFHRDQATTAIAKWRREQTLDGSQFELILMASKQADPQELESIRELLGPQDRLVFSEAAHDVAQVAEAASLARADLLFFTESHVWPTPTVLAQCLKVFAEHPEWAAFSCRTRGLTPNRLARAEAQMYEADIEYGMTQHPWRKILDQCFVTRRAPYEAAGGFDGTLGHFSEFVLAARYATLSLAIGYAPEIELAHCYIGHEPTLREFTEDFVAGEVAYWARGRGSRQESLIEPPIEWSCRGQRRRGLARGLLQIARRHFRDDPEGAYTFADLGATYFRYGGAALAGNALARWRARCAVLGRRVQLSWVRALSSAARLHTALREFTAAVAHAGRLVSPSVRDGLNPTEVLWTPDPDEADRCCGLHAPEVFDGTPFRWSEEVAVIEFQLPAGVHRLRLETLLMRLTTESWRPAFYFNGRPVREDKAVREEGCFFIEVRHRELGTATLGWVSGRQPAPGDPRRLGLPVTKLAL